MFNLLKAEARLLCQGHVLCAAATFCATYHLLVSYFDVKTEEEGNYIEYGKLDKERKICVSRVLKLLTLRERHLSHLS